MIHQEDSQFQNAVNILKKGGIGIVPTDTVFGIACRIDNKEGLKRLFSVKKRSMNQAVPVLISDISMAQRYLTSLPDDVKEKLIKVYWPGALTIVLPCKKTVSYLVKGSGNTLGMRMPDYPVLLNVIKALQVPITGTSANLHGKHTPTKIEEINPELVGLVDFILPGVCSNGISSTVIDCSQHPWKILRKGAIHLNLLKLE